VDIRRAEEEDIALIQSFDHIKERKTFIERSVRSGRSSVAVLDNQVVGWAALEYSFYDQGFVSMLYIHPEYRRRGIGATLLHHVESVCVTEKLFTSTNESNLPMQALMAKLKYMPSGIINNLDEGDPEIVYFKRLDTSTAARPGR